MADERIERLAKAMLTAWRSTNPDAPMWERPEDWYDLMGVLAAAALRSLGSLSDEDLAELLAKYRLGVVE